MRREKGFTLIELMIVIAIIAIIAAIAIPGLLQSQRASNERNASASLKTLATAEADFRANDRDGNHVNDFWTGDVSNLYAIFPPGAAGNPSAIIKLVELSVGGADAIPLGVVAGPAGAAYGSLAFINYAQPQPKAGYWYETLVLDNSNAGAPYAATTDGGANVHNNSSFGFMAWPDTFNSGRNAFIINEGNTIFKRPLINNVNPAPGIRPPALPCLAAGFNNAADIPSNWPSDANLKADYTKMD
jgi:prepilin-type N-terminal cleavage/methylation domain-containing protein